MTKLESREKTWRDIEDAALYDAALHRMVTVVRMGYLSREDALIATVLWLAEQRQESIRSEIERRNRMIGGCLPAGR